MSNPRVTGLYAITSAKLGVGDDLFDAVAAALRGGARFIQYRDKSSAPATRQRLAQRLLMLCREQGASLIINDDVDLCQAVGADGVHLGRDDLSLTQARQRLGAGKLIGVSCYNQPQLAQAAQRGGADYVAFGSFFPSTSKPDAVRAPLSLLSEAASCCDLPIVAIGGINAVNGQRLIAAGAAALAVISAVFEQADVEQAAREIATLFNH